MSVIGIGVDMESISDFAKARERYGTRFLKKAFTEAELDMAAEEKNTDKHLASRFAMKEAVMKAAGGIQMIFFNNILTSKKANGKPIARLISTKHIPLVSQLEGCMCHVSLSHSGDNAIGMAVLVKNG
jgi:holo-[acyl-carrier protein] synthase